MYEAMSPDNTYLRFFNLSRRAAKDEAQRTCRDAGPGQAILDNIATGGYRGQKLTWAGYSVRSRQRKVNNRISYTQTTCAG
jgi:hypothetical protein